MKKVSKKEFKERLIEQWGEELGMLIYKYDLKFKGGFPTIPLCMGSEERAKEIIKDCLAKGKDVYEAGYLSLDVYY